MNIKKEEIKELLEGVKHMEEVTTWKFYTAGAYILDSEIKLYASYHGQSIDENVYNKLYDDHVCLDHIVEDYLKDEFDLDSAIESIYDEVSEMIENWEE